VTEIVIATRNTGKAREIAEVMAGVPVRFTSLAAYPDAPQVEENGTTFVENACAKARAYADALGVPCLADDSGLDVDALDGGPGVRSARFAGAQCDDEANNRKLIEQMADVPDDRRGARFVCVAALAFPDGRMYTTRGECRGAVLRRPRGSNGFGYDPVFVPDGYNGTFAEMGAEEKNRLSHRAVAMRRMRTYIERGIGLRRIDVDFSAPHPHHIAEAARYVRAGEIVAVRTDTLYGLMADATRSETVRQVYALKGRAGDKPISVLVADMAMAERVAKIKGRAREAARRMWPGPVTAVLPASESPATELLGPGRSVAVRVPAAALPREVIARAGVPVTGTSANRAGQPGARTADDVVAAFGDRVALLLDSGPVGDVPASTLVDLRRWPPVVLRHGALAVARIEEMIGCRVQAGGTTD